MKQEKSPGPDFVRVRFLEWFEIPFERRLELMNSLPPGMVYSQDESFVWVNEGILTEDEALALKLEPSLSSVDAETKEGTAHVIPVAE